jgi:uncharacterized protein YegP (UPF0339 family)
MSTARAETFTDRDGGHRWRIVAGNGEIVATSEAYTRPQDAVRGLHDLARIVLSLTRLDATGVHVEAVEHTPGGSSS